MAGVPLVVARDTGSLRSAHFAGHLRFDSGYGLQGTEFEVYGNTSGLYLKTLVSGDNIYFQTHNGSSVGERLRIDSTGTLQYMSSGGKGYEFGASGSSKSTAANMFAPASYTLAFATNNEERLRITSDGKIGIGHHIATQISNGGSELTIRPANDGGILIGRPGDTVAPINKALTITTTTTGSEAYHTKYHTYNCNSIFATYEGGGTGGKFIFKTGSGSGNETERLILQNGGVLSQRVGSYARLSHGILEITSSSTPSQIKITTNLPYSGSSGSHAESVTIRGFRYGGRDTVDLQICWHVYAGQFYNRIASSSGAWAPLITLGVENNKVVIHMDSLGYWPKMYVADYYSSFNDESYAKGWSWSDSAISGDSGTPVNTVPYKNDWGGLEYNSDHGVGTNPDRHLNIKNGNLIIGTSGHGIDFSATGNAGGGAGSWNASSLNYDYDGNQAQRGFYIKIGRMVYAYYRVKFHNQSTHTGNHMRWTQLPFTADSGNPQDVIVGAHAHAYGSIDFFRVYVQPGSTYAYWYTSTGSNFNNSTSLNNADVRGCIMYKASS